MATPDVVKIPASLNRLAGVLIVSNIAIDSGLYKIIGPGGQWVFWCLVVAVISALVLLPQSIRPTQRLEITADGFTNYNAFGRVAQKHTWPEIDGHFAIIRIGSTEAIAFRLTEEYKTRMGREPTSLLSGYDDAIPGLFRLSARQVALILNNHKAGIQDKLGA